MRRWSALREMQMSMQSWLPRYLGRHRSFRSSVRVSDCSEGGNEPVSIPRNLPKVGAGWQAVRDQGLRCSDFGSSTSAASSIAACTSLSSHTFIKPARPTCQRRVRCRTELDSAADISGQYALLHRRKKHVPADGTLVEIRQPFR